VRKKLREALAAEPERALSWAGHAEEAKRLLAEIPSYRELPFVEEITSFLDGLPLLDRLSPGPVPRSRFLDSFIRRVDALRLPLASGRVSGVQALEATQARG